MNEYDMEELVAAADEISKVLDLAHPIDAALEEDALTTAIKKAARELLPDDKLTEETRATLEKLGISIGGASVEADPVNEAAAPDPAPAAPKAAVAPKAAPKAAVAPKAPAAAKTPRPPAEDKEPKYTRMNAIAEAIMSKSTTDFAELVKQADTIFVKTTKGESNMRETKFLTYNATRLLAAMGLGTRNRGEFVYGKKG